MAEQKNSEGNRGGEEKMNFIHGAEETLIPHSGEDLFMEAAFEEARKALNEGEVPVGCVFEYENRIIARGRNSCNVTCNNTRHAEMNCFDKVLRLCQEQMHHYSMEQISGCQRKQSLRKTEPCKANVSIELNKYQKNLKTNIEIYDEGFCLSSSGISTESNKLLKSELNSELEASRNALGKSLNKDKATTPKFETDDDLILVCPKSSNCVCSKTEEEVLQKSSVYVTVEPCVMCAAAIGRREMPNVVFGCSNDRFGGFGSLLDARKVYNYAIKITKDFRKEEAVQLLRDFYKGENPNAPPGKSKKRGFK